MSNLRACKRSCGTLMAPCIVGTICSSCRRGDIHGKRDAERRASKPPKGGKPTRLTLDLLLEDRPERERALRIHQPLHEREEEGITP